MFSSEGARLMRGLYEGDGGINQTTGNMGNHRRPIGCGLLGYRKWDGHRFLDNILHPYTKNVKCIAEEKVHWITF